MNGDARLDPSGQILGETTVNITYPIADLGNCASAQECFLYCAHPKNQPSCVSYAKNNGWVKEEEDEEEDGTENDINEQELIESAKAELGCDGKVACMALCNIPTNEDRCRAFAKKHGLDKSDHKPPLEVMVAAKEKLGCDSETSCSTFCQKEENHEKCFAFAKENKLINKTEVKRVEEMRENKKQMLEAAKEELGCDSKESCSQLCSNPDNREKCMNMGRRFGVMKGEIKTQSGSGGFGGVNKSTLPCTSSEECKRYCEANPTECPGKSGRPNTNASDTALTKPQSASPPGSYLGPSGCRTESECKSFCQSHPDQCPGFPRTQITPKPSLYQIQPRLQTTSNQTVNPTIFPTKYEQSQYQPQPTANESFQPPPDYTTSNYTQPR